MAKPPKMLTDAKKTAIYDNIRSVAEYEVSKDKIAPIIIMPDIAFETLIKGE